jgi:hypothetical protein
MGFLVPYRSDFLYTADDIAYDLDRYALFYGRHGYLKRLVVEDGHKIVGVEYLEIKQLNFVDPATVPGPLCQIRQIQGCKPYLQAIMEHPHGLQLSQYHLAYNAPVNRHWQRTRTKEIPDLSITYGNTMLGFFSPEEVDLIPPPD